MNATMKNTWIYDNPFERNSGPPELTEIPGTNHTGRSFVALSPPDNVPPSPATPLAAWGVESTEITISPAPSHQIKQGRGTRLAGSPLSRALAYRRSVEASNPPHDPALGMKIGLSLCMFTILVISIAGLLLWHGQDGHGKS